MKPVPLGQQEERAALFFEMRSRSAGAMMGNQNAVLPAKGLSR